MLTSFTGPGKSMELVEGKKEDTHEKAEGLSNGGDTSGSSDSINTEMSTKVSL